jgi:hypothetical protein
MIPKIIHQIWIGPDPIPDKCKNYVKTWKKHHPSWEYKFWDNTHIEELLSEASEEAVNAYNYHAPNSKCPAVACQADILRYLIILKYGGVYVDIDFECFKPIDDLVLGKNLVVASPNGSIHWVCNGFFGATPNHEVIEETVKDLRPRGIGHNGPNHLTNHFKKFIGCEFGDSVIKTKLQVNELNKRGKRINLISAEYLFTQLPHAYACHHALESWLPITVNKRKAGSEGWWSKGSTQL